MELGLSAGLNIPPHRRGWHTDTINPVKLAPLLYFRGDTGITTDGGAVSAWTQVTGDGMGGVLSPSRSLAQGTGSLQPAHDTSDNHLTFDSADDKLTFNIAVAQAGILIVATSNGIFAYEVDDDSVDEIRAVGWETGYFQGIDLYAYLLLPAATTDGNVVNAIAYLDSQTGATKNPTGSLGNYWRSRTDLVTPKFSGIDFSGVTSLSYTWIGCSSLTSFPVIDTSNVITFSTAWFGLSSLTSFPKLDTSSGTNFFQTWAACSGLISFPLLDLSSGTNFYASWYGCTSLESFPGTLDLSSGINFTLCWYNCNDLTEFPGTLDLSSGTTFINAWQNCTSLTSFPVVTFTTDAGDNVNFADAWNGCTGLTSFPSYLNLARGTNFSSAWKGCTGLTSFPAVTFSLTASDDVNFTSAWQNCTQLESFPALNLSRGTTFSKAWSGCNDASFTSFPVVTFSTTASDDINFHQAWYGCTAFTSFPALDLSRGTNFTTCWGGCSGLTSFPSDITFSTDPSDDLVFNYTWSTCYTLTSFPALDLSRGTNFAQAWWLCTGLVSFPSGINMSSGTKFTSTWLSCTALTTFPAGIFDDWSPASVTTGCFQDAWGACNVLTEQSVENILLSISASGVHPTSDGTASGTLIAGREITIDSNNVNVDNLSASNRAACTALQSRGWVVVINGSVVSEYALSFNGSDEYVNVGNSASIQDLANFSMSFWFKADTLADFNMIYSDATTGYKGKEVRLRYGKLQFWTYNMGTDESAVSTTTIVANTWYHVVVTHSSAGKNEIFINGALEHDDTTAGSYVKSETNGYFGRYDISGTDGGYWDGEIDEASIWDVVLDADAVAAVYNSGSPINLNEDKGNYDNSDDLVSWWRMGDSDSGAGNFVTDVIATDGEALHLPGVASNYASVPDAADLDGFTDFTLEAKGVTLADWTPAADQGLMSKYVTGTNSRSWRFELDTTGVLYVILSFDGTATVQYTSTAATGLAAGVTADLMAIRNGVDVRFYVNGVQLGTDVTCVTTALHNSTSTANIGLAWNTDGHPMDGSIQRARVWNSAVANQATPTETPVLDVNFTLANKGWTSFTATSGQEVTINSTGDNPAAIRSATDGVLVNTPTFVVDNPPNYSNYSVELDGTDDHVDAGTGLGDALGDNYAGSLTVSMWFKADVTSDNDDGMFYIGSFAGAYGVVQIKLQANNIYFQLNGGGWARNVAFTDTTSWHHLACVYATGSEANSKMYLDGIETGAVSGTFPSASDMDFAGLKTIIGGYYNSSNVYNGKMDEVAIWNSALTSAQINAIYNGGVPAALADSPVGWWKFHEDDVALGGDITDYGSGENDGTLENGAALSRSVPAEDATWNNRSLTFDGVDQHMTTTADDTAATKSYSFWAKSDLTTTNGVFDHGGAVIGEFRLNSGHRPLLNLHDVTGDGYYFRYWVDTPGGEQDDNAWHHWVVYVEHDDITNCKLYCDGVLQTAGTTNSSGSAAAYTTGIRLGRGGTNYFDGSLDEFAVFDGELTPAQVLQIYNGGSPADLKEFSPESWWRMGDLDDAGGTTIRDLGYVVNSEMVINGGFDSDAGWTGSEAGWTFTGGKAVATEAGDTYTLQRVDGPTLVVGELYHIKFTVSDYSAGSIKARLGGDSVGPTITANGDYSMNVACTDAGSGGSANKLGITSHSASTTLKIDNFSVKQGNLVTGFTNGSTYPFDTLVTSGLDITSAIETTGNWGGAASNAISVVAGDVYEVSFDLTYTSGTDTLRVVLVEGADGADGSVSDSFYTNTSGGNKAYLTIVTTDAAANLQFGTWHSSDVINFAATNVSLKQVNGNPGTLVNTPTFSTDIP